MPAGIQRRRRIVDLLTDAKLDQPVELTGWVKTSRFSKNVSFVHVFDGSTPSTVQVIIDPDAAEDLKAQLGVGTAVRVHGRWVESPGSGQDWEVRAEEIEIVGSCDPSTYPLQKKRTSLEHLRTPHPPAGADARGVLEAHRGLQHAHEAPVRPRAGAGLETRGRGDLLRC